ncbi:MAG: hypothetical protein RI973_403 [Bacteroidota bacterium]
MKRFNTLFIGQVFYDLPEVTSTNAYALSLLSQGRPAEGTVVSTFCQTAGRGQQGNHWESEPGKNIALSVLLYPDFLELRQQFFLNMAISLAVCDLVADCLPEGVRIKWPNDIYVGDRKIAGILIQNTTSNKNISATVAGIGININQTQFLTKPPNPTSLRLETGLDHNLHELIAQLCLRLEQRFLLLREGQNRLLHMQYLANLYRFDTPARFQRDNGTLFEGLITGIDESGRLRIRIGQREESFDLKTIRFL